MRKASYIRFRVHIWLDANDEKKSHRVRDTAYESSALLLMQTHPLFGNSTNHIVYAQSLFEGQ